MADLPSPRRPPVRRTTLILLSLAALATLTSVALGTVSSGPHPALTPASSGAAISSATLSPPLAGSGPSLLGSAPTAVPPAGPLALGAPTPSPPPPDAPIVGSVSVQVDPYWSCYDEADGEVYVPNLASETVSIINGLTVTKTVKAGEDPVSCTYDPLNQWVYISNEDSQNVTAINGTSDVAWIKTGADPYHAAFDAADGYVYIPDLGDDEVTILNGSTVVATVTTGTDPINVTYDPADGDVYVVNEDSDSVSVMNGTKVIGTVDVQLDPYSGVYDPADGDVYVPNEDSRSVSVLNGTNTVTTLNVGTEPLYGGYDPADQEVYMANYDSENVSILNGSSVAGSVKVGEFPRTACYNAVSQMMYVPNDDSFTISIISGDTVVYTVGGGEYGYAATYDDKDGDVYIPNVDSDNVSVVESDYAVTFTESGLPTNTYWFVTLNTQDTNGTYGSFVGLELPSATYQYIVVSQNSSWYAHPGSFTVSSGPAMIDLLFGLVETNVTFVETGLAPGTAWAVTFGGVQHNSTNITPTKIAFNVPNGTYVYIIDTVPDWTTTSYTGTVTTNTTAVTVRLAWTEVTYILAFQETGLKSGTQWWVNLSYGLSKSSETSTITFTEPNGTYYYAVATADKTYSAPTHPAVVNGGPHTQDVAFALVTFPVTFAETGLPSGANWSVSIGNTLYFTTTTQLSVNEPNGTYPYLLGEVPGYTTHSFTGNLYVEGGANTQTIAWGQVSYVVEFDEKGLPSGTTWTVTFDGATNSSQTGTIQFGGVPNGTAYPYTVALISGYTVSPQSGSLAVDGGAPAKIITFGVVAAPVTSSPAPTFLGLPQAEGYGLGGAIIAAVVVVALVALLMRRRRAAPAPEGVDESGGYEPQEEMSEPMPEEEGMMTEELPPPEDGGEP